MPEIQHADLTGSDLHDPKAHAHSPSEITGALPLAIPPPSSFAGGADCDFDGSLGPYTVVSGVSEAVGLRATTTPINRYDLATRASWLLAQVHAASVALRVGYTLPDNRGLTLAVAAPPPRRLSWTGPGWTSAGDNMAIALRLADQDTGVGTGGNYFAMMLEQDTFAFNVQCNSNSEVGGGNLGHTGTADNELKRGHFLAVPGLILLRIVRTGLTYSGWVSRDGATWSWLFDQAFATALSRVWLTFTGPTEGEAFMPIVAVPFVVEGGSGIEPW